MTAVRWGELAVLGAAALLAGCGPYDSPPQPLDLPSPGPKPIPPGSGIGVLSQPIGHAARPHFAPIEEVAVSPDGSAALSRDALGGIRFWAALDGSRQPLALPMADVVEMSLAQRSRTATGAATASKTGSAWTICAIDTSGAFFLLDVDDSSRTPAQRVSLPPRPAWVDCAVLPGGNVAALGSDRSIALFDSAGALVGRWQPRRFPTASIAALSEGAILAVAHDSQPTKEFRMEARAQLIAVEGTRLSARGEPVELRDAFALAGQPIVAASAGADLVAWATLITPEKTPHSEVRVRHLATGKTTVLGDSLRRFRFMSLGFVGPDRLAITAHTGATFLALPKRSATLYPVRTHSVAQTHELAHGPMMRVSARGTWLAVHQLGGETRYLGYTVFAARNADVSPDGKWVAWAHLQGTMVEATSASRRHIAISHPHTPKGEHIQAVVFADDVHLVELSSRGKLRVIRWRTGKTVDERATDASRLTRDRDSGLVHLWKLGKIQWSFAVDRAGRLQPRTPQVPKPDNSMQPSVVSAPDGAFHLHVPQRNGHTRTFTVDHRGSIVLSPDRKRALLYDFTGLLTMYRIDRFKRLWSQRYHQSVRPSTVSWSPDGAVVALSSHLGAMLVSAESGEVIKRRCALRFEVRTNVARTFATPSICR